MSLEPVAWEAWSLTEQKIRKVVAMRLTKWLSALILTLGVGACAFGQDVHYNYDRGTNFSSYKTYQWLGVPGQKKQAATTQTAGKMQPPPGAPKLEVPPALPELTLPEHFTSVSDDELLGRDIQRAVDAQLAAKGLQRVESGGDLLITYHAAVREEKNVNLNGSGWGGRGYGGWWDGNVQGQTSSVPVGAIVIDMYDASKKQLVWRGDASKTVDIKKDPNKNYRNLEKAMTKLFKNYPPPAK